MIKTFKTIIRMVFFVVLATLPQLSSAETTFGTDFSDLWWNPDESGWGVNVIHQDDILFMTFFIYGPDNQPIWYVASSTQYSGQASGQITYTGPLYQTSGPWFGTTFDPNAVGVQQVGTVTFTSTSVSTATLSYTINGVLVSKSVMRQTWRINDASGQYLGAIVGTASGCSSPVNNGNYSAPGNLAVSGTSTSLSMTFTNTDNGTSCVYTGDYAQFGRMGQSTGTFSCNSGVTGTYVFYEIEAGISGVTARYSLSDNLCSSDNGRFGGVLMLQ
ncbi:MAG: hypothetical protein ACLQHK_13135 [Gallionellaceae bacterium]